MKTEEKRSAKEEREYQVLLGLIEQYLITGKAVGSNTLKETDFKKLSSATIRNYFSSLEEQGFLMQQHASGGRIPTAKGFRAYASENRDCTQVDASVREKFDVLRMTTTQEITAFLERSAEILSETTGLAVFLWNNEVCPSYRSQCTVWRIARHGPQRRTLETTPVVACQT